MAESADRSTTTAAETRRYLPWLVAVALFMENLDATIVNTAVPTMAANLHVAPLSLKGVLTSYTLSLAVFIPISGWIADRFGTRRVFTLAIWLFLLGSLACGLAPNVPLLVAARILQGIGGAMMTPVGRLALVRAFPRSEMLRAMNYVIIPALLGPLLGPFTGGMIVHLTSWRVIFFVNIPLAFGSLPTFTSPQVVAFAFLRTGDRRMRSSLLGCSIFMTSAPMSARNRVAREPTPTQQKSATRTPESGPVRGRLPARRSEAACSPSLPCTCCILAALL